MASSGGSNVVAGDAGGAGEVGIGDDVQHAWCDKATNAATRASREVNGSIRMLHLNC